MGLFDCRCMVSGVSLKGADAALVILQQSTDHYAPLALAIKGNYNRLGSIDGIDEDTNTQLVLQFFLESLRTGAFAVDGHLPGNTPIRTIEDLLQWLERNMNDSPGWNGGWNDDPGWAALNGHVITLSLIARVVWDTIAASVPARVESIPDLFERAFKVPQSESKIYAGAPETVAEHLKELAAVDSFLSTRGISWWPSEGTGQDYPEEMRQYLDEARQAFSDSPTILTALRLYEHEVGDLLTDQ